MRAGRIAAMFIAIVSLVGCWRGENPLIARQPLTGDADSGIALATDGGIAAIALRDLSGTLTDTCQPLMPSCDIERAAAPRTRTASELRTPLGEAYLVVLAVPPGRYRVTAVTIYEGSGTRRIAVDSAAAPDITVRPHEVVLVGELTCPGYRWRSCTPVWRSSIASKRRTIDLMKWRVAEAPDEERALLRSWLPKAEASYSRLTQGS